MKVKPLNRAGELVAQRSTADSGDGPGPVDANGDPLLDQAVRREPPQRSPIAARSKH